MLLRKNMWDGCISRRRSLRKYQLQSEEKKGTWKTKKLTVLILKRNLVVLILEKEREMESRTHGERGRGKDLNLRQ